MAKARRKGHKKAAFAGLALATAGALGAYLFSGAHALARRRKAARFANTVRTEAQEVFAKAKSVSEKAYHAAIDAAAENYGAVKDLNPRELRRISQELKQEWRSVSKKISRAQARAVTAAKKGVSRAASAAKRSGKRRRRT